MTCPSGQCGVSQTPGVCVERPQVCTPDITPVCGCDGITYSNACAAASVGVSIDHDGECIVEPQTCGGIAGLTCAAGEYCDLGVGQCNVSDASGTCQIVPQGCSGQFDPVCGCDGQTYSNSCVAAAAGASVDYAGECRPQPRTCGGSAGLVCAPEEFCSLPAGQCNPADAIGTCQIRPQGCAAVYDPVCGCDGRNLWQRL